MSDQKDNTYVVKPCVVCGQDTSFACSDCAINGAGREQVHVCPTLSCQKEHEAEAQCNPNILI